MSAKSTAQVDLARLFNTVTATLKQNQQALNESDEYNHNHGDNMVQNFQTITRAMRVTKGQPPADQLSYASQLLSQRSQSGSAQLYSQGLAQAADRFQGKPAVTQDDAMLLVQALLGGQMSQQGQPSQQVQPSGGDLLGNLLGGLLGGATAEQPSQAAAAEGPGGIDLNMLLNAGMAFYQARQQGAEPMAALVQAALAGSQMQSTAHRSQSGQLVAETLIGSLGKMLSGRRR